MVEGLRKKTWMERVIEVRNLHVDQVRADSRWTQKDTADLLHRSLGSICEDLMLAEFLRAYPKQLEACKTMCQALEFVRKKKNEFKMRK